MAGASVKFEWDDGDMQRRIAESIENIKNFNPVMKAFAEYMVLQTDNRFKEEKAPDGSGWVKLEPATVARKQKLKQRNKILQQDGHLRLVHYEADNKGLSLESNREYSAIHQFGGKAGRGHKATIPKREFIGFNDEDIKEFEETVKDWIVLRKKP